MSKLNKARETIRNSLTSCAVNGMHLQEVNKEFILVETDKLVKLLDKELSRQREEIVEELEKMKKLCHKNNHQRGCVQCVLYKKDNEILDQIIKTIKKI
jgi:hypothetical protein